MSTPSRTVTIARRFRRAAEQSTLLIAARPLTRIVGAAVDLVARATLGIDDADPRAEARDRVAERVLADSVAGRFVAGAVAVVERSRADSIAWRYPRSAAPVAPAAPAVCTLPAAERIGSASAVAFVAALTAILLRAVAGRPVPLSWIVPTVVASVSALIMLVVWSRQETS